jgi:hypothetical protein
VSIVPAPDVLKSLQAYLSGVADVAALVSSVEGWRNGGSGPRVGMVVGKNWRVPTTAIKLRRAGGRGQLGAGRHETRVDVWTMGANERDAVTLWRTVHPSLCPSDGSVIGWTAANCRVTDVVQDAGSIPGDDLEVGWSVIVTPYVLTWREMPA